MSVCQVELVNAQGFAKRSRPQHYEACALEMHLCVQQFSTYSKRQNSQQTGWPGATPCKES